MAKLNGRCVVTFSSRYPRKYSVLLKTSVYFRFFSKYDMLAKKRSDEQSSSLLFYSVYVQLLFTSNFILFSATPTTIKQKRKEKRREKLRSVALFVVMQRVLTVDQQKKNVYPSKIPPRRHHSLVDVDSRGELSLASSVPLSR